MTTDDLITGTALDTLACSTIVIPVGSVYHCAVNCAVEANIVVGSADANYLLTITDNGTGVSGAAKSFDLTDDPSINDADNVEISATTAIKNISGTHTICCAAAKISVSDPDMTIDNSSVSMSCSDFLL